MNVLVTWLSTVVSPLQAETNTIKPVSGLVMGMTVDGGGVAVTLVLSNEIHTARLELIANEANGGPLGKLPIPKGTTKPVPVANVHKATPDAGTVVVVAHVPRAKLDAAVGMDKVPVPEVADGAQQILVGPDLGHAHLRKGVSQLHVVVVVVS